MRFKLPYTSTKILQEYIQQIEFLKAQIEASDQFVKEIEKGNLTATFPEKLNEVSLAQSLVSMKNYLLKIQHEEKERTWVNTGIANFSEILRNNKGLSLEDIAQEILQNLVKYIQANQGAIFLLEDDNKKDEHLKMIACYAYDRKKYLGKRFNPGEGLAGQCLLEKEPIYLTDLPQEYINITSGLGDARPTVIFICPLVANDKIYGVVEIASFHKIENYQIDFIKRLSENIASTIKNIKDNDRTKALLSMSQQQEEELRAQEEETRQNLEEMQATQEEMERKTLAIELAASNANAMLVGINATMATIEFSPQGTIITANDNFLATTGYSLDAIVNKHHRIFVPEDIQQTPEYQSFWKNLEEGNSFSGVFKRKNSKGDILWFNAIYNPIKDLNGKVQKVIKFASDITPQQEMQAANKGILNGINATMATIEFTSEGKVLHANEIFLNVMKYSLGEIKGRHHSMFVPEEEVKTEAYQTFWNSLAAGQTVSGVFERINAKGETVWLNAAYTPVFDASGKISKILKLANDITALKKNN